MERGAEDLEVGAPGEADNAIGLAIGKALGLSGDDAGDLSAMGGAPRVVRSLIRYSLEEVLGESRAGELVMVEIDPRIDDPDADTGARSGTAPLDDLEGGVGLVGADPCQSPLPLVFGVGEVLSGDPVSPELEFSRRDAAVIGGIDAGTGRWCRSSGRWPRGGRGRGAGWTCGWGTTR